VTYNGGAVALTDAQLKAELRSKPKLLSGRIDADNLQERIEKARTDILSKYSNAGPRGAAPRLAHTQYYL